MIKRALMVTGGVVLVGAVLVGRDAFSYVRTLAGYATDAVQEAVPVEFQVDRARQMIEDLVPEVRKNMHLIAKEEIEVERLDEQVSETQSRLDKEKEQLLRLKADLATAKDQFTYGGRSYTAAEVRTDLAGRFDRYKTGEATLKSLYELRDARQKSLVAARDKLEGMLASRRQLQVEVENLEARLQMLAATKATSNYQFDDSQLGRVKQLVATLRSRLQVAEKLAHSEASYHDQIPLDEPTPENIVEQVSEHFAPKELKTPAK
jgi:chromosome segregation ATPase